MREFGGVHKWDVNGNVNRTTDKTFFAPLSWQANGLRSADVRPLKVFTSSLTDIFHPDIDHYRHEIWEIIRSCPDLIFQILTKRPERFVECLPDDWGNEGYSNVWLGVSVGENAKLFTRYTILAATPARVRFLSIEPMIDWVNVFAYSMYNIDWIIVGGESGNETGKWLYRPAELRWFEDMVKAGQIYDIPVFIKQLGTHLSKQLKAEGHNIGRAGGNLDNLPTDLNFLNLRQFPKCYEALPVTAE